jgi:Protein of unknown function (DUF3307)
LDWVEVFLVFMLSHLMGDFGLQTEWQASHKHGGLDFSSRASTQRRALLAHVTSYTLAFVPALIWLAGDIGAWSALGTAALIFLPHYVQDDGRLVAAYMRRVKGIIREDERLVAIAVDQTFHLLVLFGVALLVTL